MLEMMPCSPTLRRKLDKIGVKQFGGSCPNKCLLRVLKSIISQVPSFVDKTHREKFLGKQGAWKHVAVTSLQPMDQHTAVAARLLHPDLHIHHSQLHVLLRSSTFSLFTPQ